MRTPKSGSDSRKECPCDVYFYLIAEPFGWKSRTADGMEFQTLHLPNERRQVPEVCKGPTSKLLYDCYVHCSPASAAMFCLQVIYVFKLLEKAIAPAYMLVLRYTCIENSVNFSVKYNWIVKVSCESGHWPMSQVSAKTNFSLLCLFVYWSVGNICGLWNSSLVFFLVKRLSVFRDVYLLLILIIRNFLVDERGKGFERNEVFMRKEIWKGQI